MGGRVTQRKEKNNEDITRNIRERLDKQRLIRDSQGGFKNGESCQTSLLLSYKKVNEGEDNYADYDIVYLGISKAFDKVSSKYLQ